MAAPKLRKPTDSEEDAIWDAIQKDDADQLQKVLKNEIDVNAPMKQDYIDKYYIFENDISFGGWRPLHFAALHDSIDCCKIILEYNANLSITNEDGQTALQLAIERNSYKVVYQLMVECNQQTSHLTQNQKKKAFNLINLCKREHPEIITMLLEDCPQKRSFASFRQNVHKGELVQLYKSDQWMVAYSSPPVLIDCDVNQLKPVKSTFVLYLVAVENLASRFNLFINDFNSFKKNVLLDVGGKVDVTVDQLTIPVAAIVRYKGNLPGKSGIKFGIEILD